MTRIRASCGCVSPNGACIGMCPAPVAKGTQEVSTPEPVSSDEPGPKERKIRLTPASAIQIRPVRWVWEDRMPAGSITLIPGREGIGKSLTLVWLTAQLTRGRLPGIHYGEPRPVIYAATEDSWSHTIAPRLVAAGADLDLVFRVEVEETGELMPVSLPLDCRRLSAEMRRLGVAMLAADPLMSLISDRIDTHRDRELRTALDPLAAMADESGAAVVGLAHFNKGASTDALNLITGSRAFSAVARAVLAVARDESDEEPGTCVISQAKNNLGRLNLPSLTYVIDSATVDTTEGPAHVGRLRITGETDRHVSEILGEAAAGEPRGDREEAKRWLKDYLAESGGTAQVPDIKKHARAAGFSDRTVQRAGSDLKVATQRHGFGKGATYTWSIDAPCSPHAPHARQNPEVGEHGEHGGEHGKRGLYVVKQSPDME